MKEIIDARNYIPKSEGISEKKINKYIKKFNNLILEKSDILSIDSYSGLPILNENELKFLKLRFQDKGWILSVFLNDNTSSITYTLRTRRYIISKQYISNTF